MQHIKVVVRHKNGTFSKDKDLAFMKISKDDVLKTIKNHAQW